MTSAEFVTKLRGDLKTMSDAKFLFPCFSEAHAKKVRRIFVDGRMVVNKNATRKQYTSDAYITLRTKKGLQTDYVDLRFERNLWTDHGTSLSLFAFDNWVSGVKHEDNQKKIENLSKLYGENFLKHTDKEIRDLGKCALKRTQKLLSAK